MGADQKRKEARKRKFGAQTESTVSHAANTLGENGTVPGMPATEKRKRETKLANKASVESVTKSEEVKDAVASSQQPATKKRKKDTRSVKEVDGVPTAENHEIEDASTASIVGTQEEGQQSTAPKNQRFIVFIGSFSIWACMKPI